jgi:hypothetical protein
LLGLSKDGTDETYIRDRDKYTTIEIEIEIEIELKIEINYISSEDTNEAYVKALP